MSGHVDSTGPGMNKPMPHDWSNGFGLFAILTAAPSQKDAVIVDFGLPGGPRATVLFDQLGMFTFSVWDREHNEHKVQVPAEMVADGIRHLVVCEIAPVNAGEWKLSMDIDGREVKPESVVADFYVEVANNLLTVGIDMLQTRPSRFELFSLGTFARPVDVETKIKLMKWSVVRHQVGSRG